MRQFIGSDDRPTIVRDFLLAYSERPVADAAVRLRAAEDELGDGEPDERAQLAHAEALAGLEDVGGYRAEVLWDRCTQAAFGQGYPECADRPIETLSGGERKRLALEVIFGSPFDVILLDEPDNTLDIEGKTRLEEKIVACPKAILFVSHDRTVLARTATRIVTLEGRPRGRTRPVTPRTRRRARRAWTGSTRSTAGTGRNTTTSRRTSKS